MCFGSKPKAPTVTKAPVATPRPTIEPSQSSPSGQVSARRKRVRAFKSGFASTNPTGPQGVSDEGKTKLGQ